MARMNETLPNELSKLDVLLEKTKEQALHYLQSLEHRPTSTKTRIPLQDKLVNEGLGTLQSLKVFKESYEPLIVSSSGPRYWGFVTGGTTPAAIAGDWLCSVYNQNPQGTDGQGDISALIEQETIRLLLSLFELPNNFLGGFVTGATMANFSCLAVARQWAGKQLGLDIAKEGVTSDFKILTATPHSSSIKSLSLLGLGSRQFIQIKTVQGNREAIDLEDLEKHLEKLKGQPCIVISSAGTVNSVDFDDFKGLTRLKEKYNFWWHIDAAFGGFAACSPKYKHLLEGWEMADTITIDCHKWMNVPYESAIFLVKEEHKTLQVETFQNSNAPYLGDPLANFSYLNFLPENSRRLKALPAWFSLMAYGKDGFRQLVEDNVSLAQLFGSQLEQSREFELLAPVRLNTVCFTLKGSGMEEKTSSFLIDLNWRGKVFMTPTFYKGKAGIRAAFVNWRTTEKDINLVLEEMKLSYQNLK